MSIRAHPRIIPVYVVVPPRALLLDIAGPMEALRKTTLEQHDLRFEVTYVGPRTHAGRPRSWAGCASLSGPVSA